MAWLHWSLWAPAQAAILLTGYNRWGNFSQNPSGEVASRLNGSWVEDLAIYSQRIEVSEQGVLAAQSLVGPGGHGYSGWPWLARMGCDRAPGLRG